jgi:hypothetical protein
MSTVAKCIAVALLLAVAAALGFAAHSALGAHSHRAAAWEQAGALARQADRQKAIVPALTLRARALAAFERLSDSGPVRERSRAALLGGLLELENANQDRVNGRSHLEEAAAAFKRAVRLDPANDDAAYDLELLLTRSKSTGQPVGQARPEKKKSGVGRPAAKRMGSGY